MRTSDLIDSFRSRGWRAAYASPSSPNEHAAALAAAGVPTHALPPNRQAPLAAALAAAAPTAAIFDRFYAEEAYSFRVREAASRVLRCLDMQDFHALRAARRALAERGASPEDILACRPDAADPDCLRELAAIHRYAAACAGAGRAGFQRCARSSPAGHLWACGWPSPVPAPPPEPPLRPAAATPCCRSDLTLVCSPVELRMLTRLYGVPAEKLALAPFFAPHSPHALTAAAAGPASAACLPHEARQHFCMIGNWRHPPNLDSARWACAEVWPALRAALPPEQRATAKLHLYGAYPAGAAQQLHRPVSCRAWEGSQTAVAA